MRIISEKKIKSFKHFDQNHIVFKGFIKDLRKVEPNNFGELKQVFSDVDNVGNSRYVFNVKSFRIIGIVRFNIQTVFIRFIGTHAEYDTIKNIKEL